MESGSQVSILPFELFYLEYKESRYTIYGIQTTSILLCVISEHLSEEIDKLCLAAIQYQQIWAVSVFTTTTITLDLCFCDDWALRNDQVPWSFSIRYGTRQILDGPALSSSVEVNFDAQWNFYDRMWGHLFDDLDNIVYLSLLCSDQSKTLNY